MDNTTISVSLPPEVWAALRARAEAGSPEEATLVAAALQAYLAEPKAPVLTPESLDQLEKQMRTLIVKVQQQLSQRLSGVENHVAMLDYKVNGLQAIATNPPGVEDLSPNPSATTISELSAASNFFVEEDEYDEPDEILYDFLPSDRRH